MSLQKYLEQANAYTNDAINHKNDGNPQTADFYLQLAQAQALTGLLQAVVNAHDKQDSLHDVYNTMLTKTIPAQPDNSEVQSKQPQRVQSPEETDERFQRYVIDAGATRIKLVHRKNNEYLIVYDSDTNEQLLVVGSQVSGLDNPVKYVENLAKGHGVTVTEKRAMKDRK